jgi:hypothetical protein
MAFTRGLYYPWIDFRNTDWLRSAVLYWDTLHTIVPVSIRHPYSSSVTEELVDAGVVQPLRVHPRLPELARVAEGVIAYLSSPEGAAVVTGVTQHGPVYLHPDKLPRELRRMIGLHPQKFADNLRRDLRHLLEESSDGWLHADPRFAAYYMTLLATELANSAGIGLIADAPDHHNLASAARLDVQRALLAASRLRVGHWEGDPSLLAQGMLGQLSISSLQIDPSVPTSRLLHFRKLHADELGRFRTEVAKLTSSIDPELPIDALRQCVQDIYKNEVRPAFSAFKKALRGSRIRWTVGGMTSVAFFSSGAAAVPQGLLGLGTSEALLAGAGLSMLANTVLYNVARSEDLTRNPYSYLHHLSTL